MGASVASVREVAVFLMVYVIGIIGCVSGAGVWNCLRVARRSTCRVRVGVGSSDAESESESESLSPSGRAVGAGWVRNAGVGK